MARAPTRRRTLADDRNGDLARFKASLNGSSSLRLAAREPDAANDVERKGSVAGGAVLHDDRQCTGLRLLERESRAGQEPDGASVPVELIVPRFDEHSLHTAQVERRRLEPRTALPGFLEVLRVEPEVVLDDHRAIRSPESTDA